MKFISEFGPTFLFYAFICKIFEELWIACPFFVPGSKKYYMKNKINKI